jgi:hypothetical protein
MHDTDAATEDHRTQLTRQVLADLQARQDANPDVIYELRADADHREDFPRQLVFSPKDEILEHDDAWEMACKMADILSGQWCSTLTIWQVRIFTDLAGRETRREEFYIVDSCGGSQYWDDQRDDHGSHQVSSSGFCWTCLHPDYDLDQEWHGLIRHPVTPDEIGLPAYRCFVCGVEGDNPDSGHEDVDHTVIWGEELHPRCEACGLGYQIATPQGIDYVAHADDCRALGRGSEETDR